MNQPTQRDDAQFVGYTFGAALTFMAILVAVVGLLVPIHDAATLNRRDYVTPLSWLIWGATAGVVLAASTAGLALAWLRGCNTWLWLITLLIGLLVVGSGVGVIVFALSTIKS